MKRYGGLAVRGALLLMESLWIYAFVAFVVAITIGGGEPSFLGMAAVVFGSFAISRVLQGSDFSLGVLRFWGALLSILVFYMIVRVDFYGDWAFWDFSFADALFNNTQATVEDDATAVIAVPVMWLFWMRGVLRSQQSIVFDDVVRSFGIGVVVVGCVELFAGIDSDLPREVHYVAIPYIAVGLLAIGLTHTARAADQFEREFTNVWLMVAGGAVAVLGLFALLFVVIDFDTARDGLSAAGRGIGYVVAGIFYVVLWPVLKLVELMFEALRWLQDLWGGTQNEPIEDPQGEIGPEPAQEEGESPLPGWVDTLVRVLVAGGLIGAVMAGVALLFARYRKEPDPGEVRETTYQEGRLAADLSDLLGSVFGRFRRGSGRADGQAEPARRLYYEMVEAGEARGVERRPMETPLDLAPRLGRTFGGQTANEITDMFDDVRYGGKPPSEQELKRLRDDWERIPK